MREIGEVIGVKPGRVHVLFVRKAMCGCCQNKILCGMQKVSLWIPSAQRDFKCGDHVEVEMSCRQSISIPIILYFNPSVLFVGTILFSYRWGAVFSGLSALIVIGVYFLVLKIVLAKVQGNYSPQIIRKT